MSKLISVISICYNEELNIRKCYQKVKELFQINKLNYEHIFADNCSKDNTKKIIEEICQNDKNIYQKILPNKIVDFILML